MKTGSVHVFENAGLGIAPFSFVGIDYKTYQACQGAPIQPGGTCDYCGTGIMEQCLIRDANGKMFKVGNSCVRKTGDENLINPVKREINRLRNEAKREKQRLEILEIRALLKTEKVQSALKQQPHPKGWNGKTLLDYVTWMFENAGYRGMLQMKSYIQEAR